MIFRLLLLFLALSAVAVDAAAPPRTLTYRVVAEHPHDARDFTQGLILDGDTLVESTGLHGRSVLARKRLADGHSLQRVALDARYFGEGTTRLGQRIFQLTWLDGLGFIYDTALTRIGRFRYRGEGWGLTTDGRALILSDGSDRLRFVDPATFAETRTLPVTERGTPLEQLNELEFARGLIWANVWQTDRIVAIEPASGAVAATLDLAALRMRFDKPAAWSASEHVLNGIAWDAARDEFLVTGKCWPTLFRIAVQ